MPRFWLRPVPWLAALAVLGSTVLFFFDPGQSGFYPGCLFYRATGLLCPGCGSLRALHQLLHGHLATALHFNPLLVISLLVLFGAAATGRLRLGTAAAANRPARNGVLLRPAWLWVYLAVALAFGVLRNLPGAPFSLLRP